MRYAVVKDEVCVNIVVAGEAFAAEMGFVEIPDAYGIGDIYRDGAWQKA